MTILERILSILDEKDLPASDLCRSIGLNYGTFNAWKNRGSTPSAEYIAPIAEYLGVPDHYILTGEGSPILVEAHPKERNTQLLMEYWQRLNELGRAKALVSVYDLLRDAENTETKTNEYGEIEHL